MFYDDTKEQNFDYSEFQSKFVKVIVVNKKNVYEFDNFVDNILRSEPHDVKVVENFDNFSGENNKIENVVKDTGDLLNSYVDSIETDLDKDKLKNQLQKLYIAAPKWFR